MTEPRRQALHILLSEPALHGIDGFARYHGISRAALFEAIGHIMAEEVGEDLPLTALNEVIVSRARAVDAERRARPRASAG